MFLEYFFTSFFTPIKRQFSKAISPYKQIGIQILAPSPPTSDGEISADLLGKERQGKKWKWSRKEGNLKKGKVEN